jgi:hypothetical protein
MKHSAAAAIAAFLSRFGVDRAPSLFVRVSLQHTAKTANVDAQLPVPNGGSNKPVRAEADLAGKVRVHLRFDAPLLARVDAAVSQQGITRTAWLHRAAFDALGKVGAIEE